MIVERRISTLAVILAAQLVIIAALTIWRSEGGSEQGGPLLSFDRDSVDAIVVADADGSVRLERGADGWQIAGDLALPADDAKVTGVLDKLAGAEAPWPVATTESSVKRFEVAKDHFQRHIELFAGDAVVADLYLGTSPGFRKVHARRADDDAVYAITFANYEAPTKVDEWLDRDLLKPHGAIESVSLVVGGEAPSWSLERAGEGWQLAALPADRITNQEAARGAVDKVRNLRVLGVSDRSLEGLEPAFAVRLHDTDGEETLTFYQPEPDSEFLVTSSRRKGVFRAAEYAAESVRVEPAELIALAPAAEGAAETPSPADAG